MMLRDETGSGVREPRAVLCYGDSNTWGSDPADADRRFPWGVRWPSVLQRELGEGFHVVEEGLGSRTTVIDDPLLPNRSGLACLAPCLESHAPLDLVIIMLGTNDISYAWVAPEAAADGAGVLAHLVRRSEVGPDGAPPHALLVCPPPVGPVTEAADLYAGAEEKSRELPREFARVAAAVGCAWMDAGAVVATSPLDGWHLDARAHALLGVAVAKWVRQILG
jgi:lysophospholipase L1-like esterase